MNRLARVVAAVALAAIALAAVLHFAAPVSPFDDAYIIFRYVDHILEGRGPVYNDGEHVLGVSCPLYAAWLVLLRSLLPFVELPALAVRGNALFLVVSAALAWLLIRRLGFGMIAAAAASAGLALSEGILRASLGGMESSLFVMLLFGAALASLGRRDATAMTLASLAALTRPEGLLLLVIVGAVRWIDRGTRTFPPRVLAGLSPLALYGAGAMLYYGTPIPHPVIAKAQPLYEMPDLWALSELLRHAGAWTLGGMMASEKTNLAFFATVGALATLWSLACWWRATDTHSRGRALALPAFIVLLVVAYAAGNPLLLPWYYPLVEAPWLVIVIGSGLAAARMKRPARVINLAAATLVLLSTAAALYETMRSDTRGLLRHGAADAVQSAQLAAYARAAEWLTANTGRDETIAAAEIGILGYRLDRRILDGCGLVSPEAIPFLPAPRSERGRQLGPIPSALVRATRPAYVVALPAFIHRSLLADPWFVANYRLVHEVPFQPDDPFYRAVQVFKFDGG